MLIYKIYGLVTDIPCHILFRSFSFGTSQQYVARIGKQLTCRFLPVLPRKPSRKIFSISVHTMDMALCRTLIFSALSTVEDVTGIRSCTSTTADEEYSYKDSFISTNSIFSACCSIAHKTRRNATTKCLLCTSHCLYASLKLRRTR